MKIGNRYKNADDLSGAFDDGELTEPEYHEWRVRLGYEDPPMFQDAQPFWWFLLGCMALIAYALILLTF